MSEFPALREALVRAATRRRRRRIAFRATLPTLAVGAAAVALFALPGSSPQREKAAQPPQDAISRAYGVFRRPPTAADALPANLAVTGTEDRTRSRRLGTLGKTVFYAVPTIYRGGQRICVVSVTPGDGNGSGCAELAPALRGQTVPGAWAGTDRFAFLFPDGTRDVRLTLSDHTRLAPAIHGNAVFGTAKQPIIITSWTAETGERRIIPDHLGAHGFKSPVSCPEALDPLPKDAEAQARRAALIAVDRIYPVVEADVTAVTRGGGTCHPARTLTVSLHLTPYDNRKSDSLSQGRLLVGMVDGHMQVFAVMH